MSKTRKEKLIEEIQNKLEDVEKQLIETPEGMSSEEYQELIRTAKELRQALEIVKKF